MATLHPPEHLLMPTGFIPKAVQMLDAAAAFTRTPEEATLMRNLRLGMMADTKGCTKMCQKVPGALLQALTVSNAFGFVSLPC
jgi:hypothetical protein